MPETDRVAVLIDCDNISRTRAAAVLAEAARHGTLGIKRGYGDWTSELLKGWKDVLPHHAIQPVQQFAWVTHKNATDSALIIDAMDLLYSGNVDAFCLVSSDSDFTRLAMRLRESGKRVFGMGARNTPEAFRNACDRFTFLDLLDGEEPAEEPDDSELPPLRDLLGSAIEASATDDDWAMLGTVGWYMVNKEPTFDSRNYGYTRLGQLVRDQEWIEVREVPDASGFAQLWVRVVESEKPKPQRRRRR